MSQTVILFLLAIIIATTNADVADPTVIELVEPGFLDQDTQSIMFAEKSANIDYLSFGYDIFSGNPHSTYGVDPGFQSRIFNLTYLEQLRSSDGNWDIPDNTNMARIDSCALNFNSSEISNMASYSDSLGVEVSVSGGYVGVGSFKASTDYKSTEKTLSGNSDKYIYSGANCDVYRARSNFYDPPNLHKEFIIALRMLPANYSKAEYFQFLEYFGTHAVAEIFMGARFAMTTRISYDVYEDFRSQGVSVTAAASLSLFGASGGFDTRTASEKEKGSKYSSAITEKQTISVGVKPVKNGDGVAWAQQVIQSPMPLRYKLIPLSEIVTTKYLRGAIPDDHAASVKKNIQTAFENYCKDYLLPRGMIANCNPPPTNNARPIPVAKPAAINSCKWCANKCGGDFPINGGRMLANKEWPKWAYDYDTGCSGNYKNNEIQKEQGVNLCCQPVEPKKREGQCRICASCGGDYPEYVGATAVNSKWDKFVSAYDNNCNGDSRQRNPGPDGLKFCCHKEPICSLCRSCGGTWPQESGVLGADEDTREFWRARGFYCAGGITMPDHAKSGMKWCCKTK